MSERAHLLGASAGLASAADLAEDWAALTEELVGQARRRATPEAVAEFEFALAQLDPALLHAHVSQHAAGGLTGFARALRTKAADEAGEAVARDPDLTPTELFVVPDEAKPPSEESILFVDADLVVE